MIPGIGSGEGLTLEQTVMPCDPRYRSGEGCHYGDCRHDTTCAGPGEGCHPETCGHAPLVKVVGGGVTWETVDM